jgi:hypothetical protein
MNIEKEWERDPPVEPMTSLAALWRDFERRRADPASPVHRFRDNIPDWCVQSENASVALWRAVKSIRPNGKMHNHQSKVSRSLDNFARALSRRRGHLALSPNFDILYHRIKRLAPKGIGEMTVYDVATRFGAYLGLKPEMIYMHAGTRSGLNALLGTKFGSRHEVMPMWLLPTELQDKDPDTVEDFLCTYRSAFLKL